MDGAGDRIVSDLVSNRLATLVFNTEGPSSEGLSKRKTGKQNCAKPFK